MGLFTFVFADGKTVPLSMTYKVAAGDIQVTMLLPSFTSELLIDPDLSILLGDQDIPSKRKKNVAVIAGATAGGVALLVIVITIALYMYMRKHRQTVLFHSDKDKDSL